ncbi:NAD(P)/FAD-dependent oxidoreductase [Hutsoniella sourekii]
MTQRIAIIGGGIVGSTAAYYLSRAGLEVDLFDEGTGQATKASAGIICPWFTLKRNKPWYFLVSNGAEFYRQLMSDLSADAYEVDSIFQVDGALLVRRKEEILAQDQERSLQKQADSPSIGQVQALSADQVNQVFPLLESDYPATFVPGGGRVHGQALIDTLQQAVKDAGGQVIRQTAQLIDKGEGQVEVASSNHPATAYDAILASSGAWLPQLLEPLGYQVDIRPQKGQLFTLSRPEWSNQHWPVVMPFGQIDLIPFNDGSIAFGASHENDKGYDLAIDPAVIEEIKSKAQSWMPQVDFSEPDSIRVGIRAYTSDYAVLVGAVPELNNFWAVSGLGSSGLTSGPFLGYQWSQLILNGEWKINPDDFPIDRYIQKVH